MHIDHIFALERIWKVLERGDLEVCLQNGREVRHIFHIVADDTPVDADFLALVNDRSHGADDGNLDFGDTREIDQEFRVAGVDEIRNLRA